jgi:hypothetical protein
MSQTRDEERRDVNVSECDVCGTHPAIGVHAGLEDNPAVCAMCARIRLDGGRPAAGTRGGREAPYAGGEVTQKQFAHFCDVVGSTVYAPLHDCPLGCAEEESVE